MITIKLLCSISGPAGMFPAGSDLETTDEEAASLVAHGLAEYKEAPVETKEDKGFQTRETTARKRRK